MDQDVLAESQDTGDVRADPYDGLGKALQWCRLERGATRREVKDAAGISLEYLGKIERGERRPQPDVLLRLAGALDTTPGDLFRRSSSYSPGSDFQARSDRGSISAVGWDRTIRQAATFWSLISESKALRQAHTGRTELLAELQRRVAHLTDDELAMFVASIPPATPDTSEGRNTSEARSARSVHHQPSTTPAASPAEPE